MRINELELGKAYLQFATELNPSVPKGYSNPGASYCGRFVCRPELQMAPLLGIVPLPGIVNLSSYMIPVLASPLAPLPASLPVNIGLHSLHLPELLSSVFFFACHVEGTASASVGTGSCMRRDWCSTS